MSAVDDFRTDIDFSCYFSGVPDTLSHSLQEQDAQYFIWIEQDIQSAHGSNSTTSDAKKKPFSCPRCNKVYNWRTNLLRHLRLECGKEPQFHCSYCPYKTKQKSHLTRHVAGRHRYLNVTDYLQFPYHSDRWTSKSVLSLFIMECLLL